MGAKEKCGVFGVVVRSPEVSDNIAKIVFTGLFQLQHRGRESAGISIYSDGAIKTHKGMGTIDWVFREQVLRSGLAQFITDYSTSKSKIIGYLFSEGAVSKKDCSLLYRTKTKQELLDAALDIFEEKNTHNPLDALIGSAAIGHVRYSTTGASGGKNVQPILFDFRGKDAAIAHNGNVATRNLKETIEKRGGYVRMDTTDTGLIAALIATSERPIFLDALIETLVLLEGAFSLVVLYEGVVYAIKDTFGIRPLCIGKTDSHFIVASESRALANFRAEFLGEIDPGTMVVFDTRLREPKKIRWANDASLRRCIFEDDYFSMPDSLGAGGVRIALHREAFGAEAAREHPILDADVVTPVLDSGLFHARGYSREDGKMMKKAGRDVPEGGLFQYAFIRGRVERTFMNPIADERKLMQHLKHSIIPEVVAGKHVVVVDDSIVRGDVIPYIVESLTHYGAKKVSVVIPFPPLRHPCHLGIDLPLREDYIAHNRNAEDIRKILGVEYLGYLSLKGLYKAIGQPRSNFCDGCLTNEYPVPLPDELVSTKEK